MENGENGLVLIGFVAEVDMAKVILVLTGAEEAARGFVKLKI